MALRLRLIRDGVLDAEGCLASRTEQVPLGRRGNKRCSPAGLRQLFDLASKLNLISNDRFAGLARWAEDLATSRVAGERIKCMAANELDEMVVDDTLAVPLHDELEHDWFAEFARTLPLIRNDHAHGSETVRFNVLRTFEVTAAMASSLSSALQEIEGAGLLA